MPNSAGHWGITGNVTEATCRATQSQRARALHLDLTRVHIFFLLRPCWLTLGGSSTWSYFMYPEKVDDMSPHHTKLF